MTLMYRFPVVSYYGDAPEENEVDYLPACVTMLENNIHSCEAIIRERGWSLHIIFGQYQNGGYLCVPSKQFGCNLSDFSDISWNLDEMTRKISDLDYEDATAIAYALAELSKVIDSK